MSGETRELIQLYEKLPKAERAEVADFARFLVARRTVQTHAAPPPEAPIRRTEGVAGGNACVRNTRIPVWTLVQLMKLGRNEAELMADFPGLTRDDLDAVWNYYRQYTDEIEKIITAEAGED